MEKENINLTINGDVKQPIEIVLREGEAIKHHYPKKYTSQGVISAPCEFAKRVTKKSDSVVEYSYKDTYIRFLEDPTNADAAEVKGTLTINPDLVAFGINKDRYFTSKELITFARKYAHCFQSLDDVKELITSLQNFEVKFESTHVKNDDRKGNTEEQVKNAIKFCKGEVKSQFNLSLPLFIGTGKVNIDIEVEIERRDVTPVFGFYSLTLESKIQETTQEIMDFYLESLKDFTCIQIS